ncbi:permease [Pseudonocardia sp. CA-107938]|uniref:permease n=1 Tax=Pseudonocardia sp. CA-107938 TaxID=3240021 RepID=UPI003D89E621
MVVTITAAARRVTSLHACCAVLVAVILARPLLVTAVDAPGVRTAATVFVAVCVQALPFLVLGVVVSGAIAAFVPARAVERLLPGRAAVPAAGVAGLLLPGCECASVPVARRMIGRGVPDAAALTFLLAAPAINPVVLVATAVAFPGEPLVVLARGIASFATACVMGLLWQRRGRPEWIAARVRAPVADAGAPRWVVFAETARHDLVSAGGFLVVGGLAAAVFAVAVPASWTAALGRDLVLAIAVMAVLAVVLALCSEADAFVVASMSTVPLTARLAFLVVGPAVDVKLIALQAGTFGRAFALRFAPATLAVAVLCATVTSLLLLGTR